MKAAVLLIAIAVVACSKKKTPTGGPSEVARIEKQLGEQAAKTWIATSDGVFLNHKLVVPPDKLGTPGALRAAVDAAHVTAVALVPDLPDRSVSVVQTMLRDLDGIEVALPFQLPGDAPDRELDFYSLSVSSKPIANPQATLSLDFLPDRVYVGFVPANEFTEIRHRARGDAEEIDWDMLEQTLKQFKASPPFVDRNDLELAVDPAYKTDTLLVAAELATKVGFKKLAILPRDQLTAKAILPEVVDLAGLTTAAEVIAKLREHEGKDGFTARVGKQDVCEFMKVVTPKKHPAKPAPGTGYFVAIVHKDGGAWLAMTQTMDPKEQPTTEYTDQERIVSKNALGGELNNMRLFTHIKEAPLELAAEEGVDAATFLTAIDAACHGRTFEFELRAPGELSRQPH